MAFTLYKTLDQQFIDNLTDTHKIDSCDVQDILKNIGYSGHEIADSPNPIIYCIFCIVILRLLEELERMLELSNKTSKYLQAQLKDSIYLNYNCSNLQANYVFKQQKDLIEKLLKEQGFSGKELEVKLNEVESLFEDYNY